jgi:hypothetical protein
VASSISRDGLAQMMINPGVAIKKSRFYEKVVYSLIDPSETLGKRSHMLHTSKLEPELVSMCESPQSQVLRQIFSLKYQNYSGL